MNVLYNMSRSVRKFSFFYASLSLFEAAFEPLGELFSSGQAIRNAGSQKL